MLSINVLNLNSLLVTYQMTIFHQGVQMGKKFVPRMCKRSELGYISHIVRENDILDLDSRGIVLSTC